MCILPPLPDGRRTLSRRRFVELGLSCGAHLALLGAVGTGRGRRLLATSTQDLPVVADAPWGRLVRLADGAWALVSTPLDGDWTTLCNGGIVAGRDGLLVIEAFASPEGAAWMAARATELAGFPPTHVVLTHYHGDHVGGLEGIAGEGTPRVAVTEATRVRVLERDAGAETPPPEVRTRLLEDARLVDGSAETELDLGGRTVRIVPREGHTASDVTVELADPSVVFCGDLVWNRMFPNYVDAVPTRLSASVRALRRERETLYVPGHGPLAGAADLDAYRLLLDDVEEAARRAVQEGMPAWKAAESYALPPALGDWTLFNPRYFQVALAAWESELTGVGTGG